MAVKIMVRDLRLRRGLTQWQLAVRSGLSLRTIQRMENGESSSSVAELLRVAQVLDAPLCRLVSLECQHKHDRFDVTDVT